MSVINIELIKSYEDKELIQFLYKNFCIKTPEKINYLDEYALSLNVREITGALHALKNLFANVGAEKQADFCQSIEDKVSRDIKYDFTYDLTKMRRHYSDTRAALKEVIDTFVN